MSIATAEPTSARRATTRSRLIRAGLEVFSRHGFGAPIEDICAAAGLTRGAFYSNYADREELFLDVFDEHAGDEVARVTRLLQRVDADPDPLLRVAHEIAAGVYEDRAWLLVSAEFTLHAARSPRVAARLAVHDMRVRSQVAEVLSVAIRAAGRMPTTSIETIAAGVIALREGAAAQIAVEPSSWLVAMLADAVLGLLLGLTSASS